MEAGLAVEEADPASPEAAELLNAANFREASGVFVIGHVAGVPVACGALRPMEDGAVEVKRMYVGDSYRGRGLGRAVLAALEAIALYQSSGYRAIPCYGIHATDPRSRCFEKQIGGARSVQT